MPKLILNTSYKDYKESGNKFIEIPAGLSRGDSFAMQVKIGMVDWDTPGKSLKFPVTVISDGANKDKADKLAVGVAKNAIWKLNNLAGQLGFEVGNEGGKVAIDTDSLVNTEAWGIWTVEEGVSQRDGTTFDMAKLNNLVREQPKITN